MNFERHQLMSAHIIHKFLIAKLNIYPDRVLLRQKRKPTTLFDLSIHMSCKSTKRNKYLI
jgi:activator of HSP90 ATPase